MAIIILVHKTFANNVSGSQDVIQAMPLHLLNSYCMIWRFQSKLNKVYTCFYRDTSESDLAKLSSAVKATWLAKPPNSLFFQHFTVYHRWLMM